MTIPSPSTDLHNTPLHLAAHFGNHLRAFHLLSQGADTEEFCTDNNYTAMHVAADLNQREVLMVLLANGANPNAHDVHGWTPLHYAVQRGHDRTVELLLRRGRANIEARNAEGETPLHRAVGADNEGVPGMVEVVRVLLDHGADKGAKDNCGFLAVELAAGQNKVELKRMLE